MSGTEGDFERGLVSLGALARKLNVTCSTEPYTLDETVTSDNFTPDTYYTYAPLDSSHINDSGYKLAKEFKTNTKYYTKDVSKLTLANIDVSQLMCGSGEASLGGTDH